VVIGPGFGFFNERKLCQFRCRSSHLGILPGDRWYQHMALAVYFNIIPTKEVGFEWILLNVIGDQKTRSPLRKAGLMDFAECLWTTIWRRARDLKYQCIFLILNDNQNNNINLYQQKACSGKIYARSDYAVILQFLFQLSQ
jgi:hypothetical protein